MRVRALVGFSGVNFSMYAGQEGEITDKGVLKDLLSAKYIEVVKEIPKKGVRENESK